MTLTQDEEGQSIEQGTNVGENPHTHSKLQMKQIQY